MLILPAAVSLAALLASCSTPAGTGAATGAATGAVVGGPVGAAVGAGAGAIIGAAVGRSEAKTYGTAPSSGWPVATPADQRGFVISPYTQRMYDVRAVPQGGLVRDVDANKLFRVP